MPGKTIRIYLVDGTPNGILTAEIINWTGKIIVAPRSELATLARRPEVRKTGVYLLVGSNPDNPLQDKVYVGEGDNVLTRLMSHDRDETKDFWTKAIIVTSKDENVTKAHGRFLESHLIQLIREAGRALLANGTEPDAIALPESDVSDMQFFLEQLQYVLPVLGMNFLQRQATTVTITQAEAPGSARFYMREGDSKALAVEVDGEFVVLAGSPARKESNPNWTSYKKQRDALVVEGKLQPSQDPQYFTFASNVAFASPSAAAAIVAAGNRNGRTYWRVEGTNQTYGEWQDEKLAVANEPSE
jgi:hypothetical protein